MRTDARRNQLSLSLMVEKAVQYMSAFDLLHIDSFLQASRVSARLQLQFSCGTLCHQ